jgi:L-threonylcarbamoyladenylate synthase
MSILPQSTEGTKVPVASPGLLKSHYSPDKPLFLAKSTDQSDIQSLIDKLKPNGTIAFISFSGFTPKDVGKTMYLSNNGNLKEAAVNLFSILHNLEEDQQTDYIIAEQVPGQGIAKAIMDKLHKASYRYKNPESNEKD